MENLDSKYKEELNRLNEENKRLRNQNKQLWEKERSTTVIYNYVNAVFQQNDIDTILWDIAKNVIGKLAFIDCVVYILNPESQILEQKAAWGAKNPKSYEILDPVNLKLGEGIVGTVAQTGIPEIVNDTTKDDRYIVDDDMRLSEIAVPIIIDNRVFGVIDSEHPEKDFFTETHLEILLTLATISAYKIKQVQTNHKLKIHQSDLEKTVADQTSQLTEMIDKLKKSNEELQQFAYIASHDFRQPLRMISSYLGLLNRKYGDNFDEDGKTFINFAMDGAQQMDAIIQDLLSYARLDYKELNFASIDLNDVVNRAKFYLEVPITKHKVVIKQNNLPEMKGDFTQLVQLFQNLIDNAIKFRSDQPPVINIDTKDLGSHWEIKFSDNGLGIQKNFQDQIFQIFSKYHNKKDYKGTGIGLAICKRIIHRHGGDISVQSEDQKGTTFIFSFAKKIEKSTATPSS